MRTLFSKIFLMHIVVAVTAIVVIIPLIFFLIGNYFIASQEKDIIEDAVRISQLSESIIDKQNNADAWNYYKMAIEFASRESKIIVINSKGDVVASSNNVSGVKLSNIDEAFVKDIKNGRTSIKVYNKGKIFNEQTLVATAPIIRNDAYSGKGILVGATLAVRGMPYLKNIQNDIVGIVIYTQSIVWIIAFIISFVLTRQITSPIKKMKNAAKSIANGNFKEKIPITSNDEIGQLAESFNSMTESLRELENMRSSFVSDVSHELRTPMTIISGFVEGIIDGTIPENEREKYLGIVLSEAKRLTRLVSELLEASKLEQGKAILNKESFDMNRMLTETLISYEQQITHKNIKISLLLEGNECNVFADKDSIKRVLMNLIENAIKFTPVEGKITLKTETNDKKVLTSVENTGEGIAENDLKHIWERFYKTDKSRGEDKKGAGLGLHIVKTIITKHNGEIFAKSKEGEYTRFAFTLDKGEENTSGRMIDYAK
ncbi:MAG: HAMP domain-containing protein [Clostridia bacterium]|nr:HAMP domain-containing protein [Clostridia bacterium]